MLLMARRRRTRPHRFAGPALLVASVAVVAACGLVGAPDPAGTTKATVGAVTVHYPDGWAVLPAADRPQGWAWAAQDRPGTAGTVQVAVNGDFSALDVDFATASLLSGAQIGTYQDFTPQAGREIEVHGADRALRTDFGYRVDKVAYQASWLVARGDGPRTVAVQVSGREPVDEKLIATVIDGMDLK